MARYVARRLLQFVPTLFGTLFLLHYLTSLSIQLTGNPVRAMFGDRTPTPAQLASMTKAMGLDDACLRRVGDPCLGLYVRRLQQMAGGDFGHDFRGRAVLDILGDAAPSTVKLALIAFLVEAVVGIGLGVIAGVNRNGPADYAVRGAAVAVICVPVFVLAYLVQLLFGVYVGRPLREASWAPEWLGMVFSPAYRPEHPLASMLMAGVVLGLTGLTVTAQLTRTNMAENLRADFVRTAQAKGVRRSRVIGVHALRASLLPVVTNLGITLATLMGGAIVVESIFNIPGAGRELQRSLFRGEVAVVIGAATLLVLIYLFINLLVDLLYVVIDPRIRYE
jgi:peptide/nickel transport system permease protein/oligopeptide transport system permease protein